MTEYQRLHLEEKERRGTITKKELRRLNASREAGRSRIGYGEKHSKDLTGLFQNDR